VREIRTLRLTRRELETWPWWNCEPTAQSKESGWKPSTYCARASSRPYRLASGLRDVATGQVAREVEYQFLKAVSRAEWIEVNRFQCARTRKRWSAFVRW